MPLRDRLRKFKIEVKSRVFQADESNGANTETGKLSSISPSDTFHNWTYLKLFLKTLEKAPRPFYPLKTAVAELVQCIDIYENVLHKRKEYEILYDELERLFQSLQIFCTQNTPPAITTATEALSIQNEIAGIRQQGSKGKLRGYLEAGRDADAVLERYRRIQGHLQRISLNSDMSVWRIVDEIATEIRLKYLLPSLSSCYNSAQAVELKRGPCTGGTRVDVLNRILSWVEASSSGSIYWMNGMAGTGKTTIAYSLCEELDASCKLAASFFCSRLLPECRDVNLIIPSIAYQLARSSHPFRFVLSRVLEQDPDVHTRLPHLQFDALISKPLLEIQGTLPDTFVVVVDALDECENKESTSRILDVLLTKSLDLPVRFVVSSRPEPEIRDEMEKQNDRAESRVVLHELDKDIVQADIETYLRSALAQIQPTEAELAILVERAGILFIYAATVVRYIGHDKFHRNPRTRLANILELSGASENKHKEIDELYVIILRAALDDPSLDNNERGDMRRVLHSVICAQEPLTINALSNLLIMNADRVRAALRPLRSVLHISGANELVTTLHASFSDYILDFSRSKQYYCDSRVHNQTLSRCCFNLFRDIRQFNICNLESSYKSDDEVEGLEERVKSAISMELSYASRYWAVHLHSTIGSPDLISELEEFLSIRLLVWMEVMSLKGCVGAMPRAIRQIENWEAERSTDLNALIHDAWRFTSTFALGAVSDSTPHIYVSMLPFWPESSPVAKCYAKFTRRVIQAEGTAIEQRQHALLATWNLGGPVFSPVFSPDGTQIAVGVGNDLLLLNSSTGRALLPPFKGHYSHISSVQFAPDCTRIASGSFDKTIRVWSTQNGGLTLGPLGGYLDYPSSISFSPDGSRIVSGSGYGNIYIWDACNGERLLDLSTGHINAIKSVKYSPDGCSIVSCSEHKHVLIWDALEGQVRRVLSSDSTSYSFISADISPDGIRIASGSDNGSVHIWDYGTGSVVLGPLIAPGAKASLTLVSFSPDGLHLVSGSADGTICLWDTWSGDLSLGPLEGHTSYIVSASFSPDGAYFICGSGDTLCLWDAQITNSVPTPLEGHTDSVASVGFSPDGSRILSSSNDRTICVWDAESGELILGPLEQNVNEWVQLAFLPDGTHIISSVKHGIVLLDAQTGDVVLKTLQQFKPIESVGFSSDGTRIAFGLEGGIVRILASDTGQTLLVIHLPLIDNQHSWASNITFSPDGTRVAVGSKVTSLIIYDADNGRLLDGPFPAFTARTPSVEFSPDSTRIVYSTGFDLVIKDVQSGEEILVLVLNQEQMDMITSVGFSPDGSRVVSGSRDSSICIWDAQTGQLLLGPFKWHAESVKSARLSSDGMRVVSGSNDKTIRVTDIQPVPIVRILDPQIHSPTVLTNSF
ncbi:unnamed protein product [Rhizoctonia solani]|uniref:Nephrocystin 3-like N-terminal domain-containing protein n=1 Tax=Rhizoctonia solani TaxID=456999 RepID=A0A8H3DH38_9AGAM|nr:unnamed protein product [Rhizoctonia solani]